MKLKIIFGLCIMMLLLAGCNHKTTPSNFTVNKTLEYVESLNEYCAEIPNLTGEWYDDDFDKYYWSNLNGGVVCFDRKIEHTTIFKDGKNRTIGVVNFN